MNSPNPGIAEPIIRSRMPELDTIRGVAILLVFWFHGFEFFTPATPNVPMWERLFLASAKEGWAGVNLFFVLSGFLITGILLDSLNKPRYYSRFYYRRALRILPAYYLLLLVLVLLGQVLALPQYSSWGFIGLSFIYLSNLTPMFGVPMQYGPLWSLAVEEHYYLLWPTAVRFFSRRGLLIAASLICVIEPALRIYALAFGGLWAGPHRGGTFSYTWMSADGLALGALLAIFARSSRGTRVNLLKLAFLAGVAATLAVALSNVFPRPVAVGIQDTCVNYYAFFIVSGILWVGTGRYKRWVNVRLLSFFGFISYGLYLIHFLSIELYNDIVAEFVPVLLVEHSFRKGCVRLLIAGAFATGVAYLSRITYEEFFLRMKGKNDKPLETVRTAAAIQSVLPD